MRKESKAWTLETRQLRCACGAMAQHATNTRSKRRRVYAHQTPDGKECPHYAHQENLERTNKALAACNLPLEDIPNAPIRFD